VWSSTRGVFRSPQFFCGNDNRSGSIPAFTKSQTTLIVLAPSKMAPLGAMAKLLRLPDEMCTMGLLEETGSGNSTNTGSGTIFRF